jgi:hypothetical protein
MLNLVAYQNGCVYLTIPRCEPCKPDHATFSDYYAALLRTHQAFVAPTQGKLLNYVQRTPLGVVAQITVSASGNPQHHRVVIGDVTN